MLFVGLIDGILIMIDYGFFVQEIVRMVNVDFFLMIILKEIVEFVRICNDNINYRLIDMNFESVFIRSIIDGQLVVVEMIIEMFVDNWFVKEVVKIVIERVVD